MTFSLVARCEQTGMFGMAISSSSPAVAARCAFARAGIGAVASQNITDPSLGIKGLDLLAAGHSAAEALDIIRKNTTHLDYRQLLIVDANGETAIHSGRQALGIWAQANSANVASGGNLLANNRVPQSMVDCFLRASGHLGDRLIMALQAGRDAGGEAGPVHSAGLLLVDKLSWPIAEIRCDWSVACPIEQVRTGWAIYKPQIESYIQRALNPEESPSYGVPGDE
ncbi:MAG: DUF1028 domain-containing protein [Burkholderiaceae bacterium]